MRWVNDGAKPLLGADGALGVLWTPAGEAGEDGSPFVMSMYMVVRVKQRYQVVNMTTYSVGMDETEWVHRAEPRLLGEARETRREAEAWARRDAEAEANNPVAVAWDGVPA